MQSLRVFKVLQWYQWYTDIVQGSTNATIGNTIGTNGNANGNANGTIGTPNGTIGTLNGTTDTNGKPMVPLATLQSPFVPRSFRSWPYNAISYPTQQGNFVPNPTRL